LGHQIGDGPALAVQNRRLAAAAFLRRKRMMEPQKQLLHLVFGGELEDPQSTTFADLSKLDLVGIFPNYRSAREAWQAKAQATVDNARVRYFVVHLHRLLDPDAATDSD
jgi:hypothetical protein